MKETKEVEITDINYSLSTELSSGHLTDDVKKTIESAEIIILPETEFGGKKIRAFYRDIVDFYKINKPKMNDKLAICENPDEIRFIDLKSHDIWLPIFYIIDRALLPLAISLISGYILYKTLDKPEKNKTRLEMIVNDKETGKSKSIKYYGNSKTLIETLKQLKKNDIFR